MQQLNTCIAPLFESLNLWTNIQLERCHEHYFFIGLWEVEQYDELLSCSSLTNNKKPEGTFFKHIFRSVLL